MTSWARANNKKLIGLAGAAAVIASFVLQLSGQGLNTGKAVTSPGDAAAYSEWQNFLNTNCVGCHSESLKIGSVVLEGALLQPKGLQADLWERVIRKLEAGEMPPPSVSQRPDAKKVAAFKVWLTRTLDQYPATELDPGRPTLRRLTRAQYSNAIRDLLAVDVNPGDELPPDVLANGFDNNGDALSLSPLLLEKYAKAARQVTRLALGDPTLPRTIYALTPPDYQDQWRKGLPFGARGMPAINHYFPADGEYVIRVYTDLYDGGKLPDDEGKRFFQKRFSTTAGPHKVAVAMPEEGSVPEGPIEDLPGWGGGIGGVLDPLRTATRRPILDIRFDGKRLERFNVDPPTTVEMATPVTVTPGSPWIRRMEIDGPYGPGRPGTTASRARVLVCEPKASKEEGSCSRQILTTLARRAFRREVTGQDIEPFLAIYQKARVQADFSGSVQQAIEAILVSPLFLFRIESDPPNVTPGKSYVLDSSEVATRLSFFLWNTIPDDTLLDLARAGKLNTPAALLQEMRRMMSDNRASALVDDFGMQFVGLHDLESVHPDELAYPAFNTTLRDEMGEEVRLFLRDIVLKNGSILNLIGAKYSYINERLAKHYGVPGVSGPAFRRVEFGADSPRGGILGMGALLMATSHTNVTSPVFRGKWVLSSLLNQPPSPPPPGVPTLVPTSASGRKLTGREQMEQHRTNPVCASCHSRMDPFGFALENYDVMGVWRQKDEGGDINPVATMPDGSELNGIAGLRQRLLSRPDDLARAFAERLMTYAIGRKLSGSDAPAIRRIVQNAAPEYRFNDLVSGVLESPQFRMRRKEIENVHQ